jgi:hypothetical protein
MERLRGSVAPPRPRSTWCSKHAPDRRARRSPPVDAEAELPVSTSGPPQAERSPRERGEGHADRGKGHRATNRSTGTVTRSGRSCRR